jgi:EAL domain-containing protein (putative c-di-GMP-specific phosphodiesterase class I)
MLENRLWQALEQNEFELYLQPQVGWPPSASSAPKRCCAGTIRNWGMVGPDRFIPIAEESALILPLGDWVLQRAIACWIHGAHRSWRTCGWR